MAEFAIKGWCPTALRPMMAGDGLVVRIRPRMAYLTSAQASGIAAAAAAHGNGLIDLSSRGNIQLRGIREDSHQALLADLAALGLIDRDQANEAGRNILVTPFWTAGDGTTELVAAAEKIILQAAEMPSKFGIVVDTGPVPVLAGTSGDIRLEHSGSALILRPDGADFGRRVTAAAAAKAVLDLQNWFIRTGGVVQGRGRMAAHIARVGLPDGFDVSAAAATQPPNPGRLDLGFMVGFEFGQMQAATLAALATGPLRITPWRMILVEGATTAPDMPSLITVPDDPRLRVSACTGAPSCPQGLQPTRALATRLAPSVPAGQHLHVSGCAKGCAHSDMANVTLTATATGFDIVRDGRAGDPATAKYDSSIPLFKAL